jgi:hypothetical protein
MFGRNVDFVAVLFITLVMLGAGWARSWSWPSWSDAALDSIRVENAIVENPTNVERCPLPREFLSNLSCILHR